MEIQEKIDRFNVLQKKSNLEEKEKQEINHLANEFLAITKQAYDDISINYSCADRTNVMDSIIEVYNTLFEMAEEVMNRPIQEMTVLDVGAGTGKENPSTAEANAFRLKTGVGKREGSVYHQ